MSHEGRGVKSEHVSSSKERDNRAEVLSFIFWLSFDGGLIVFSEQQKHRKTHPFVISFQIFRKFHSKNCTRTPKSCKILSKPCVYERVKHNERQLRTSPELSSIKFFFFFVKFLLILKSELKKLRNSKDQKILHKNDKVT